MRLKNSAKHTQQLKTEWEKSHVQRVINSHNNKYGTHIENIDRPFINPSGNMPKNCDFICTDKSSAREIAIEVKNITNPKLEGRYNSFTRFTSELQEKFNQDKKLHGIFLLTIDIARVLQVPWVDKTSEIILRDQLFHVIYRIDQYLKVGKEITLLPYLRKNCSFSLSDIETVTLEKLRDQGHLLGIIDGMIGGESPDFDQEELIYFEGILQQANRQLEAAKVEDTFLILVEEKWRPINCDGVQRAINKLKSESYSNIKYVYYTHGDEVTQIILAPTSPS